MSRHQLRLACGGLDIFCASCYGEIEENAERIYIGNELPEEYTESESRKSLMGAKAKAKANAATAIPELIQIASNPTYEENRKEKHNKNARYGWYRYDVRFAIVSDISFEIPLYIIPVNLAFPFETDIVNQDQLFTVRIGYDIYVPVFNHLFCSLSSFLLICRH